MYYGRVHRGFELFANWEDEQVKQMCFLSQVLYIPHGRVVELDWSDPAQYVYFVMRVSHHFVHWEGVCVCVRACVRACVNVRVCVCERERQRQRQRDRERQRQRDRDRESVYVCVCAGGGGGGEEESSLAYRR